MALSAAFVAAHIQRWRANLTSDAYPHRKWWPECLFHHAPLENAVSILTTGVLRSRNDPLNVIARDVAAREVNQRRGHAHDSVRLYCRPRTPTQFNIEGIRKPGECRHGDETQAPVLVMFALDAQSVLTLPNVRFSDRNMQAGAAVPGDSEDYFAAIPFAKVFHEGPTGGDDTIIRHRCAEVLPSSPLDLGAHLKGIFLRSEPERDTLLHLLGEHRHRWQRRCHVSDALKVFEKKYSFVQELSLTREGVVFILNPRIDAGGVDIRITVSDALGQRVAQFQSDGLAAMPPNGGKWIFKRAFADGYYRVKIEIDGHLAFENGISLTHSLF